jgi:alpha-amylase
MRLRKIWWILLSGLIMLLAACEGQTGAVTPAANEIEELQATADTDALPVENNEENEETERPRTVFVHLFEWTWPDIALECEKFLGPQGFAAVQVSPPQEHVLGDPWWVRYQPVSYKLESRGGSSEEFSDMVERCGAAGVDIYVDAVINHMSGGSSGTGSGGSTYSHYNYPGLYSDHDFHHCDRPNGDISNYDDRWEVQNCELSNLADLATDTEYVREQVAAYMNGLIDMGVDGFRIDAAKHMSRDDIAAIVGRLDSDAYIYQEVIDQGGEPITAGEYFQNGDVTEFKYSLNLGRIFRQGRLAELEQFGESWSFIPSTEAIVFVDNHDNQRGHGGGGGVLTHKDGRLYELATLFMLGWPYGYPQIMSSFAFTDPDAGPPTNTAGEPEPIHIGDKANCFEEWVCEHRWQLIANMVTFRNVTNDNFFVTDWWSNNNNQIAFGRGDAGFVVINREDNALSQTFQTGMAAGNYCDVISGGMEEDGQGCSGGLVHVNESGRVALTVPAMSAVAFHRHSRLADDVVLDGTVLVTFQVEAETVPGENIFVVGSAEALGNWDPVAAIPLSADHYPLWQAEVELPAATVVEYKYIRLDEGGNVTWESDPNRSLTTTTSAPIVIEDRWR